MRLPLITVIIPIHNEARYIERCLNAILNQDYPGRMEILIADGMSTDGTREIIQNISASNPHIKVHILDNPGKIVPTGLNAAIRQLKGEIIIRVDGHTVIAPDYVRRCVEMLQRTKVDNVGGRMNTVGETPFGKAVALATSTPFGIGGGRFHYSDKEELVDTVYLGAWSRKVFDKIGLFDDELVRDQDDEFNYRLRERGGRILLSPAIHSKYSVRNSPYALWQQYYQYGYWKVRVFQKHHRQMRLHQFIPPALVLVLLFSASLAFFPVTRLLSPVVPLIYLAANLLVSIWTASKRGWRYLPLLPLTFAILHLSYGLGFLVGLVKFWNRWNDKIGKVPHFSNEPTG